MKELLWRLVLVLFVIIAVFVTTCSPPLQADSLPAEPQGKPLVKNLGFFFYWSYYMGSSSLTGARTCVPCSGNKEC